MEKIKIVCTVSSENSSETLSKLKDRGADFFRINLSHTPEEAIEERILQLKKYNIPIILDTEGPQIRSGNHSEIILKEGSEIRIYDKEVDCSNKELFLRPFSIINKLKEGDLLDIDFNSVLIKVSDISKVNEGHISCVVLMGGKVGGRKAVHIDGKLDLPTFSKKDIRAANLAKTYGIDTFTLSFIKNGEEVRKFREISPGSKLYAKIECRKALENFEDILDAADGILIDRGDLSREIPVEKIPFVQKYLLRVCNKKGKKAFVATNTLENMSFSLKPSRSEANDIINTILDGATGIALTKETAVGKYPVETLNMLLNLISQIEFVSNNGNEEKEDYALSEKTPGLLNPPHGGKLVERYNPNYSGKLPSESILIDEETLMDVEQIAVGAFSPLEGFMGRKDLESVVDNMKLANGTVWPLPILLGVDSNIGSSLSPGKNYSLVFNKDKSPYAILNLEEVYQIDKLEFARKIFGTSSLEHPGVKRFMDSGDYFLGGKITLIKRRNSPYKLHELTPKQTRKIFSERGWAKVIGFHTRNVIHRSHEFIQMEGLKRSLCDGLLIHPVIGKKKPGDFEADIIIESYEKMINQVYPKSKVMFCTFANYSRYCGPREAVFTALVRKNFGCSHFIVGRDHTGVKNFYSPSASHAIFDKFSYEELGIVPVKFDKVFYSTINKCYIHEPDFPGHPEEDKLHISGTEAREMLKSGEHPPKWFMRPEISEIIEDKIKKNEKVFVK